MFCENCGQKIEGDFQVCPNCGAVVEASARPEEENTKVRFGMQSVLKGTYIIGEVIEEGSDVIIYNGFNLKTGKTVYILEGMQTVMEQATLEEDLQMMTKAFHKAYPEEETVLAEQFIDSDIFYVVLQPEKHRRRPGENQSDAKDDEAKPEKTTVQPEKSRVGAPGNPKTDGQEDPGKPDPGEDRKPSAKAIRLILVAALCVAALFILKTVGNSNKLKAELKAARAADVGDIITFGSYEQDNNTLNGKENIEWLVLAKEDDRILVTSKYALDCQQYNTEYTGVTW